MLSADEQEKYFEDANQSVKRHAFYMKAALDDDNLHEALRNACNMINELRTSKLFPTRYYELYMNVTNELSSLEGYIEDEYRRKSSADPENARRWLKDLYDRVQYAGNIVPRLYLLLTVGCVCIKVYKSNQEETMQILFDMVEMSKGVQHPTRGLFLRNYLSQIAKGQLPDVPESVTVENLDDHPIVKQSVEFVLQNFAEMTRLWVRMQHQGAVRDRSRREKERLQLRMLVGTNLIRLSDLTAISKPVYRDVVLTRVLEQITKCKDRIAQEYLMDCVIHVFADEYHLVTLDTFLEACGKLSGSVNVKDIIASLMDRLATFAQENRQAFEARDVFAIFRRCCAEIIEKHKKMNLEDILNLQVALVNFGAQCYPGRDEYVAAMITEAVAIIEKNNGEITDGAVPHVRRMLAAPLVSMNVRALELQEYCRLMDYLSFEDARGAAQDIVRALLMPETRLETADIIERLFTLVSTMLYDQDETPALSDDTRYEFEEEQHMIACLVHAIYNEDTDEHYKALHAARKFFGKGGEERNRIVFPSLIFNALQLVHRIHAAEQSGAEIRLGSKKGFLYVHQIAEKFAELEPELGVRYWAAAALAADKCDHAEIAMECMSQALLTYEERVGESDAQEAIRCMVGTIQAMRTLDEEQFDTLCTKCTKNAGRVLKKDIQSRVVAECAHIYWNTHNLEYRDPVRTSKCLSRALKTANGILEPTVQVSVFIEVLNKYVYFLSQKCEDVLDKMSRLVEAIKEKLGEFDEDDADMDEEKVNELKSFFRATCRYIVELQGNTDPKVAELFQQVTVA